MRKRIITIGCIVLVLLLGIWIGSTMDSSTSDRELTEARYAAMVESPTPTTRIRETLKNATRKPTPEPSPTPPPPPAHQGLDHYALRTEAELIEELGESFGPFFGRYPKITFLSADMSYTECYLMRYMYEEYDLYFYLVEIDGEMRAVRSHIWIRQKMEDGVPKMDATNSREDVERLTGITLPAEEERSPVRAIWRDAGESVHEIYADKASVARDLYDIVITYEDGLFMDTKRMEIPGAKLQTTESPNEPEIEVLMTAKKFSQITEDQLVEWMGPPWEVLELSASGYAVETVDVVYYTYYYGNYEYEFLIYDFPDKGRRLIDATISLCGIRLVNGDVRGPVAELTTQSVSTMLDQSLSTISLYAQTKSTLDFRNVSDKIYSISAHGGIGSMGNDSLVFQIRFAKHILHERRYRADARVYS